MTLHFVGKVRVKNKKYEAKVTSTELLLIPVDRQNATEAIFIDFSMSYGTTLSGAIVTLYGYRRIKDHKLSPRDTEIVASNSNEAKQLHEILKKLVAGIYVDEEETPRRHFLVMINPTSGTRKAVQMYKKDVAPIFDKAPYITTETVTTASQGDGKDKAMSMELSNYDAIIIASGDGLMYEVINGLMAREDWEKAIKMPVGILPCGSGNGLAATLNCYTCIESALALVKLHTRPLDIWSIRQPGSPVTYAFLEVIWAIIADVDIESEKYRWAGSARFTFSGLARMLNLRKYPAKLKYLPFAGHENDLVEGGSCGPKICHEYADSDEAPPGWKVIEDDFVFFTAMNTSHQMKGCMFGPYCDFGEGAIDLCYIVASPKAKSTVFTTLTTMETGNHVDLPNVKYVKAKAFVLEPLDGKSIIDVDGEHIPHAPTFVESFRGLANLICPKSLKQPPRQPPTSIMQPLVESNVSAPKTNSGSVAQSLCKSTADVGAVADVKRETEDNDKQQGKESEIIEEKKTEQKEDIPIRRISSDV